MIERVYLDTNTLRGSWPGIVANQLHQVATLAKTVGAEVCIPQSVITEFRQSTFDQIVEHHKKARESLQNANLLTNGVSAPLTLPQYDVEAARTAFDRAVERAAEVFGFVTIPVSTRTVDDFVRLAAAKRPPFKPAGEDRGFRDAVHLYSIIEDLGKRPISGDGWAVFITKDEFLSNSAEELSKRFDIRLEAEPSLAEPIRQLTDRLEVHTRQELARLADTWRPIILKDCQNRLLSKLLRTLYGLNLGRGMRMGHLFRVEAEWEPESDLLSTPVIGAPSTYASSFRIRIHVSSDGLKVNADGRRESMMLNVTLLVNISADIDATQPDALKIVYRSAQVSSVMWNAHDIDRLPQNIELLTEPV